MSTPTNPSATRGDGLHVVAQGGQRVVAGTFTEKKAALDVADQLNKRRPLTDSAGAPAPATVKQTIHG
jgi:hypothetical protein